MSVLSAPRRVLTAALLIGGLGFAGALAASTTASADAKASACQGAFTRNKTKIEQLAAKPGSEGAIARIMASGGCSGTGVSVNRAQPGDGQKGMRLRLSCHFSYPPSTISCKLSWA